MIQPFVKYGTGFWVRGLLAILLFGISFWLFYAQENRNKIDVKIHLVAERIGIINLYWPDSNGNFSEQSTAAYKYPKGLHTVKLQIHSFSKRALLRLDPGKKSNSITIQSINFERFGNSIEIPLQTLQQNIVSTISTDVKMTADGLFLKFSTEDPQIFLQNMPQPEMNLLQWTLLIIILISLPSLTWFCAENRLPSQFVQPLFLSMALCLLGWLYSWNFYILVLPSALLAVSLVNSGRSLLETAQDNRIGAFSAIATIIVFGCCLFIPFTKLIGPDSSYIKRAKELLSEKTAIEAGGLQRKTKQLTKDLEENLTFHFPSRTDLIDLNAKIKIFGLGYSPTSKAIVGEDGYFFEGYGLRRVEGDAVASFDNITDYMGLIPLSEQQLEEWRICLEERYYWLKELGTDYVFTVAPSKAAIYPEKLPKKIYEVKTKINRPTRYNQLLAYLQKHSNVPVIDLQKPLFKAKLEMAEAGNNLPLYYKTDFHWTYLGSFLAYRAIIDNINRMYPQYGLKAADLGDFKIHERKDWVHFAFIYSLGLKPVEHKYETYLTFFPNQGTRLASNPEWIDKGINDYSLPEMKPELCGEVKIPIRVLTNTSGEEKMQRLFVIGDSFAEKYVIYFSAHAAATYNFRTVFEFNPSVYQKYKPDLVVQEMLNMYLLNNPPRNPPEIKAARIRALEKKNVAPVSTPKQ